MHCTIRRGKLPVRIVPDVLKIAMSSYFDGVHYIEAETA